MELAGVSGPDDRTCRICGIDISGMRSDAQTCSDAHKKALQRLRARMIDDVSSGPVPAGIVSHDDMTARPVSTGASDIGLAGAASRQLNRARRKPRIIDGGKWGDWEIPRESSVSTSRAIRASDIDWSKVADNDYR